VFQGTYAEIVFPHPVIGGDCNAIAHSTLCRYPTTHPIALGLLALPYLHHLKEEIAGLVGIIGGVSYTIRFPMEILQ